MTQTQTRTIVLNTVFWAGFLALWINGVGKIPFTESTGMSFGILVLFAVGQLFAIAEEWKWVEWTMTALIFLGLIGTVIGFIIAFSGVKPDTAADISSVKPMVAALISGMATALYTTLIGSIGALWLSLCERLFRAA